MRTEAEVYAAIENLKKRASKAFRLGQLQESVFAAGTIAVMRWFLGEESTLSDLLTEEVKDESGYTVQ